MRGQANIHVNDNNHWTKTRKQYSCQRKHKKRHKCNTSHGKWVYPKTAELKCWQLLDVMWDVKAARLMWGMSSEASRSWFLITSKLWRVCHKSRESDTWWEVSELILACDFQLLKIDLWNKGCLCMLPWEKQPMHASLFCSVLKETSQLNRTCKRLFDCLKEMRISGWELGWLPRRFAQFLGRAVDCCLDLQILSWETLLAKISQFSLGVLTDGIAQF